MTAAGSLHDQPSVNLSTPAGDRATVLLHGAHVVSWIPAGDEERLYLSECSTFGEGCAIRGGVPVIFPQFNQRGPDFQVPRHGFARTRQWSVEPASDAASVTMRLVDDTATRSLWPHPFSMTLTVTLAHRRLDMALRVENTGPGPLSFTAALHTYLAVADITRARLDGLAGVRFLDTVADVEGVGPAQSLQFDRETDRIYFDVPAPLSLAGPNGSLTISMAGFRDAVIWNPWVDRSAALPDMPDDGYRRMLCIEAAAIGRPVELDPAGHWLGRQTLTAD